MTMIKFIAVEKEAFNKFYDYMRKRSTGKGGRHPATEALLELLKSAEEADDTTTTST